MGNLITSFHMNDKQKENTATTLLDLGKATVIGFIIGGFIPGASINPWHMILSSIIATVLYILAMFLLKGGK